MAASAKETCFLRPPSSALSCCLPAPAEITGWGRTAPDGRAVAAGSANRARVGTGSVGRRCARRDSSATGWLAFISSCVAPGFCPAARLVRGPLVGIGWVVFWVVFWPATGCSVLSERDWPEWFCPEWGCVPRKKAASLPAPAGRLCGCSPPEASRSVPAIEAGGRVFDAKMGVARSAGCFAVSGKPFCAARLCCGVSPLGS